MRAPSPEWFVIACGLVLAAATFAFGSDGAVVVGIGLAGAIAGMGLLALFEKFLERRRFHRDVDRLVRERKRQ